MLRDHFFYGIKAEMRNSIRHLYDSEKATSGELLLKLIIIIIIIIVVYFIIYIHNTFSTELKILIWLTIYIR